MALDEIKEQIKAINPAQKDLRNLGLTFLVALVVIAAFLWFKQKPAWPWLAGIGALFGLWGFLWPAGLRPIYFAWMSLAAVLGYFTSRILLASVYYLMVTPIGLILRLLGKDVLDMKLKDRASYWHERSRQDYDPQQTEKMY